jgi:hypothetical protein
MDNPKRALTVAQKSSMIETIFQSWIHCPELRLGQLIVNAIRSAPNANIPLFYLEDSDLENMIVDFVQHNS